MICVTRPSDCSTSVGIVRADEATGICATVVAAEATSAISKATQAFRRGKLVEIKSSYSSSCAVSNGSYMTWTAGFAKVRSQNHLGGYHTVFLGSNKPH